MKQNSHSNNNNKRTNTNIHHTLSIFYFFFSSCVHDVPWNKLSVQNQKQEYSLARKKMKRKNNHVTRTILFKYWKNIQFCCGLNGSEDNAIVDMFFFHLVAAISIPLWTDIFFNCLLFFFSSNFRIYVQKKFIHSFLLHEQQNVKHKLEEKFVLVILQ